MHSTLVPEQWVRPDAALDWAARQVQSVVRNRVIVKNAGKRIVHSDVVPLETIDMPREPS